MAIEEFSASAVIAAYQRAVEADQRRMATAMRVAAMAHFSAIGRTYPSGRTGTLSRRIGFIERNPTSWQVLASAPHVHLWERGTRRRQTRAGLNRGVSPAHGEVFIPLAIRMRREASRDIQAILNRLVEV